MYSILVVIPLLIDITSSTLFSGDLEECIKSQRIIGGVCASITDRPFQALLFIENEPKCGASIISDRWILTAAHCVQNVPKRHLSIEVGSSKVRGHSAKYYGISSTIVHPDFQVNSVTVKNDIALARTSEPMQHNDRVKPITLNRFPPKKGDETVVSGYGVTSVDKLSKTSDYLMSVDGKVIGSNRCKSMLRRVEPEMKISNGSFCAGNLNGGKDSCQGDSGGPVTIGKGLAGVVSWGLKCAERMPAFYTDVSYYFDWIVNNMNQHNVSTENSEKRS